MEFTLGGAAIIAMACVYIGVRLDAGRANAAHRARDHWDRAIAATVIGVLAGRVVAMVLDGVSPISQDLLIIRGGVDTVGATIAAIAAVAWRGRRDVTTALDGLAAAALVGLAGWHAGCLVRDSCLGTATDLPWGMAASTGGPTRHPVELYAAVLFVVAGFAISWLRTPGRLRPLVAAALALASAGAIRLVTEPMRLSLAGGPVWWYLAAFVLGSGMAVLRQRRISLGAFGEATG